jgi:hypothetical protein
MPSLIWLETVISGRDVIVSFRLVRFFSDRHLPDAANRGLLFFQLDDSAGLYTDLAPSASHDFEIAYRNLASGEHRLIATVVTRADVKEYLKTYWVNCFVIE